MRSALSLFLVLILVAIAFGQFSGKYEIASNGDKIGEIRFEMRPHPTGFVMNSTSTMTISGTQTISDAQTHYDHAYHPQAYRITISSPSGKQEISAKFASGKATIMGTSGIQQSTQDIEFSPGDYILEQNNFAHWFVLSKVIDPQIGNFECNAIIPQLMNRQKLVLKNIEQKNVDGKKVTLFEGSIGNLGINLLLTLDGQLISIAFPKQHLEATLTEIKSLVEEIAEIPAECHPLTLENMGSEDFMDEILHGKQLEGHISFNPNGRLDRIYLNRRVQTFAGTIETNSIDGELENKQMSHRVTLSPEWPLTEPIQIIPEYLSPAPSIDSDSKIIIERAQKIVEPTPTLWEAARAINLWVNRNIEYTLLRYGALEGMTKGKGDFHTKSLICVAMLRSVEIPARVVRGILYADVPLDHSWVEVFLGHEIGWAPMDPTTGEVDKISARHISIWIGEEKPPTYAKDITLDVNKLK